MTKFFAMMMTVALWALPCVGWGQEWTRFRGPGGQGVNDAATQIPASFTPKDYRWKIELPGAGTSSPVLWGTKLFLTSEGAGDGQRLVLCHDSVTGKLLWQLADEFKTYGHHKFNNFASTTPAVDGRHVYISWLSGDQMKVVALTHEGKMAWEADLGFYQEDHGSGASPVVVGSVLVVSKDHLKNDAAIYGLNVADGKTLWRLPRTTLRTAFSTPLVVEDRPGHSVVVLSSNPQSLTCIDPATGKELWSHAYTEKSEYRAVGSPVFADGVFFANVGQGTSGRDGVALKLVDGKPTVAWELPKGMPYVPTPLAMDGYFYVLNDGGVLSCIKASTGERAYSERVSENAYSSPVAAGKRIYCISRDGKVTAVKAGPKFEIMGESSLEEPCESTPAIANGMMFIRTAKHLVAMGGGRPQTGNYYPGKGVNVEMLSEVQSVQPGRAVTVGFHLQHMARHHTYWTNPGIAGVPFALKWTLPEGWKAGELQCAPPDKVYMAQYRTHGYERDVIHLVEITPPAEWAGESVTLKAKASWLCCAEACNLGYADLELTLPVTNVEPKWDDASYAAFESARAALPQRSDAWQFSAMRDGDGIRLEARPVEGAALPLSGQNEPIFFSSDKLVCSHPEQEWSLKDGVWRALLPTSEYSPKDASHLKGLLYLADGWLKNKGAPYLQIEVPLTQTLGLTK